VDAALSGCCRRSLRRRRPFTRRCGIGLCRARKRIRPILCIETARVFAADVAAAHYPACAIEFIHTIRSFHDDLPALDNDDLRRGQADVPQEVRRSIAILAGDALLTLAFEAIALHRGGGNAVAQC